MSYQTAAQTYRQNAVLTASPEKLVQMLYDGAIRHLERSRIGLGDTTKSHGPVVGESLGKAMAIVGELRSTLDMDAGGEIAENLDRLYEFTLDQLSQANLNRAAEPVEHGLRVIRTLKEGWDGIVAS